LKKRGFYNNCKKQLNRMNKNERKYDIKSITEKYIKGKCTPEELEEAITLFADPYHNLELRPTLFEYWIKEEKSGK
jgi:hypothetical protein